MTNSGLSLIRTASIAVCATLLATVLVALTPDAGPATAAPAYDRVAGADRFATSVAASVAAFPTPSDVDTVYLASARNYPDALAAGPAAAAQGAALLLTEPWGIPASIAAEIHRLSPAHIVLVGGPKALERSVETAAAGFGAAVRRVAGADRFSTSRTLVSEVFAERGAQHVWIATANNYPDALAAGPAAASKKMPIVLVNGEASRLDADTRALLTSLGTERVSIAGGTSVVSTGIAADLKQLLGQNNVERAGGGDRFETAIAINRLAFGNAPAGDAYVATGLNYPDALSVAVLAGMRARPLYLTMPRCAPPALASELNMAKTTRIRLVGGQQVVHSYVASLKPCQSTEAADSLWLVVNKHRALSPADYVPGDLVHVPVAHTWAPLMRAGASNAIVTMFRAASSEAGLSLASNSAYRSYATQQELYSGDDNLTARPGYSEHQTGLTMDIGAASGHCSLATCFADTVEGRWLNDNAWRFGFLLRYPSDKTHVTGYDFEPWHYRYIGVELSTAMREAGMRTLEEYFGMPAAPSYP